MEFVSELGCRVRVGPAPDHMDPRGAMLVLEMEDVGDNRRAEVYLSPDNALDLEHMLRRWMSQQAGPARVWRSGLQAGRNYERSLWHWSAGTLSRTVNGLKERPTEPANPYLDT
jgi:hypothetical protein